MLTGIEQHYLQIQDTKRKVQLVKHQKTLEWTLEAIQAIWDQNKLQKFLKRSNGAYFEGRLLRNE